MTSDLVRNEEMAEANSPGPYREGTLMVADARFRAEIDSAIATAKEYPRSIKSCLAKAEQYATLSQEIAAACFYAVPRAGKVITGPSVRLAEIMANTWMNLRSGSSVVADEGRLLVIRSFAHDLESNTGFTFETRVKITDKHGRRYSEDMVVTTANAAISKGLRNAIFRIVPKALVDEVASKIRKVAVGENKTLRERRDNALAYYQKAGISAERLLGVVGKPSVDDLDGEDLLTLKTLANAVKEGETTWDEAFPDPKAKPTTATTSRLADLIRAQAEPVPTLVELPSLPRAIEGSSLKDIQTLLGQVAEQEGHTEDGLKALVGERDLKKFTAPERAALAQRLRARLTPPADVPTVEVGGPRGGELFPGSEGGSSAVGPGR